MSPLSQLNLLVSQRITPPVPSSSPLQPNDDNDADNDDHAADDHDDDDDADDDADDDEVPYTASVLSHTFR